MLPLLFPAVGVIISHLLELLHEALNLRLWKMQCYHQESHLSVVLVNLILDPWLLLFWNPVILGTMAPHVPVSDRHVHNCWLSKMPFCRAACTTALAAEGLLQAAPSKQHFDVEKENHFV